MVNLDFWSDHFEYYSIAFSFDSGQIVSDSLLVHRNYIISLFLPCYGSSVAHCPYRIHKQLLFTNVLTFVFGLCSDLRLNLLFSS